MSVPVERIKARLESIPDVTISEAEYAAKGFCLDVQTTPGSLICVVSEIQQSGFFIEAITGVDWLGHKSAAQTVTTADTDNGTHPTLPLSPPLPEPVIDELEVVYDFNHYFTFYRITVRLHVSRDQSQVPTISTIYPGADWHERETHDFFGIIFVGHPNLTPLLLPEDATFHPLLKDFTA